MWLAQIGTLHIETHTWKTLIAKSPTQTILLFHIKQTSHYLHITPIKHIRHSNVSLVKHSFEVYLHFNSNRIPTTPAQLRTF